MGVDGLGVDRRTSEGLAAPLACPAHSARARAGAPTRRLGAHRARAGLRPCRARAAPVSSAQMAPGASVQGRARGAPERRPRSASAPPVPRPCPAPRRRPAPASRPAPVVRPSGARAPQVLRPCGAHAAPVQNFDISHSTFGPPWCQRGGCSAYIVGGDGRASVRPGEGRPGNDGGCLGRREARDQRLGHAPRSPKLAPTRPTLRDARILAPRLEPTGQKRDVRPSRRTAERHDARSRPGDGRGLPWAWMGWAWTDARRKASRHPLAQARSDTLGTPRR